MALGARLANPAVRVLQIVGDGGFHFSTPTSVYATAQRYGLPIFTVVLDNGGWQAVKEAVLRVYRDGALPESCRCRPGRGAQCADRSAIVFTQETTMQLKNRLCLAYFAIAALV